MQGAVSDAAALLSRAQTLLEDGEGWRESKARHETEVRVQQLRDLGARTDPEQQTRFNRELRHAFNGLPFSKPVMHR